MDGWVALVGAPPRRRPVVEKAGEGDEDAMLEGNCVVT